ncbi:MAG: endonuclease, partial [Flavobacteriaceae bacterium]|nr:endonuclease [Flavobacteriaceae bacterium]
MKLFLRAFIFLISGFSFSQVLVINELDSDTPSIDDKEFVELLSETPNFPLDGYVLVFFNGSAAGANSSYLAIDLDGLQTDINGLLLIGSNSVSPVPQKLISPNLIQNGADAVAIYQRDDLDFEFPTLAFVDNTLVDVLVYGTNDPDATGLLDIYRAFDPNIQQINEGAANNSNSIQRFVDGNGIVSYLSTVPTPRQLNDGSGIVLNGIFIGILQTQYNEGDSFDITLTSEQPVNQDLTLSISLNNGFFNSFDYSGNSSLTILNGQNTTSTTITIIDDNFDEGDEVMKVTLSGLPPTFLALNNNLQIRAIDNDFQMASFGTPISPTFGNVTSTQPVGYYDSLDGLSGTVLRQGLQDIVANPAIVRAQTYNDVIDILKEADQNPENSNQVWLVYLEKGRAKLDFQITSNNTGTWNREHTFPRSRAGYNSIQADGISDGKNIYWTTNADSLRHGNSDAHALRAVDGPENSSRGNQFYGEYTGPVGTLGGFKGDVARGV